MPRVSAAQIRWIYCANLVANIGIVVTGGFVRLTKSGLGCPSWPPCTADSFIPTSQQAEGYHKLIEFGNRTLTGVLGIVALAALVLTWMAIGQRPRLRAHRRLLLSWASAPLLLIVAQAVLGGITVLMGLSPLIVAAHFLVSMVAIAVATWLWLRMPNWLAAGDTESAYADLDRHSTIVGTSSGHRALQVLAYLVAVVTALVLALGTLVTGSGPHSGDADVTHRLGFDLRVISWVHADAVMLLTGLVVGLVVISWLWRDPIAASLRRRSAVVLAVVFAQGAVGYVQYFAGLPIGLVALHMLGASLLVVAVTALISALRGADAVRGVI